MVFFIPTEIETLQQVRPWANWVLITLISAVSLLALHQGLGEGGMWDAFILDGFSLPGLLGHVLLHTDLIHLAGNMVFLWVFGNAICSNTSNWLYLGLFVAFALIAAATHVLLDGAPAVGASGAINGIVGMALALYPLNRVHMIWIFLIRGGTTTWSAWLIFCAWFVFDVWGATSGGGSTAYWAHIGGFLGGLGIGLAGLQMGWLQVTEYDNRTMLEILTGRRR